MSKVKFLSCPLCSEDTLSSTSLSLHIHKHFSYRKFQCSSCSELFFTDEEREMHSLQEGHIHGFKMKILPYCELYISKMLKDAQSVAINGIDDVVIQRSEAELQFNTSRLEHAHAYGSMDDALSAQSQVLSSKDDCSTDQYQPSSNDDFLSAIQQQVGREAMNLEANWAKCKHGRGTKERSPSLTPFQRGYFLCDRPSLNESFF